MVSDERDVGARDNVMGSEPCQLVRWHSCAMLFVDFFDDIFGFSVIGMFAQYYNIMQSFNNELVITQVVINTSFVPFRYLFTSHRSFYSARSETMRCHN